MNKITTLVPLSEFVSRIDEICSREIGQAFDDWKLEQLGLITRYNKFLLQPLELEFFVPCDDKNNVLKEPEYHTEFLSKEEQEVYEHEVYIFEKAKSKILFEGASKFQAEHYIIYYSKIEYISNILNSIVPLTLTEQALKQIYG